MSETVEHLRKKCLPSLKIKRAGGTQCGSSKDINLIFFCHFFVVFLRHRQVQEDCFFCRTPATLLKGRISSQDILFEQLFILEDRLGGERQKTAECECLIFDVSLKYDFRWFFCFAARMREIVDNVAAGRIKEVVSKHFFPPFSWRTKKASRRKTRRGGRKRFIWSDDKFSRESLHDKVWNTQRAINSHRSSSETKFLCLPCLISSPSGHNLVPLVASSSRNFI